MRHSFNKLISSEKFIFVVRFLVSVVLLAYCIYVVDFKLVIGSLLRLDLLYFFLSTIIAIAGLIFFKSLLIWYHFSKKANVSLLEIAKINLVLRFYSVVIPRVAVAAMRWHKYKRYSNGLDAVVLVSFELIISLLAISIGGLLFAIIEHEVSGVFMYVLAGFSFVFFLVLASPRVQFIKQSLRYIGEMLSFGGRINAQNFIVRLEDAVGKVRHDGKSGLAVLLASQMGQYICFIVSAYYLALALEIQLNFFAIAWVRSLVLIFAHFPMSVAGLGIRESAFIAIFGLYMINAELALAYALASFVMQVCIAVLGLFLDLYERLIEKKVVI